jgi:hypothetical protein
MSKISASCQTAEQIILPLPNEGEVIKLREGLSGIRKPSLSPGSHWANTKIGEYTVSGTNEDVIVSWKTVEGPKRSERINELNSKNQLSDLRLELGWMIANMSRVEAVRALQSIPDLNEAQKHSKYFKKEEKGWRLWAVMDVSTKSA